MWFVIRELIFKLTVYNDLTKYVQRISLFTDVKKRKKKKERNINCITITREPFMLAVHLLSYIVV